jgi:hypothetical protein
MSGNPPNPESFCCGSVRGGGWARHTIDLLIGNFPINRLNRNRAGGALATPLRRLW